MTNLCLKPWFLNIVIFQRPKLRGKPPKKNQIQTVDSQKLSLLEAQFAVLKFFTPAELFDVIF